MKAIANKVLHSDDSPKWLAAISLLCLVSLIGILGKNRIIFCGNLYIIGFEWFLVYSYINLSIVIVFNYLLPHLSSFLEYKLGSIAAKLIFGNF